MNGDLVPLPVHFLDSRVIGVLVGDEEAGLDVATVRVLAFPVEDLLVEADVVVVDGVIEGNRDHLRHVLGRQIAGDGCAILGTEAVGKDADAGVAGRRSVRVVVHVCNFQGTVCSFDVSGSLRGAINSMLKFLCH